MAPDHHTSERVYRALKKEVVERQFTSNLLNIAGLARRYHSSATPVREALLRLVGEGLIDLPGSGGFAIPAITDVALRQLYELNSRLAIMATHWAGTASPQGDPNLTTDLRPPIDVFFLRLATATGNDHLVAAVERLSDQLRPARQVERRHIRNLETEYAALANENDPVRLRRAIRRYHERRLELAEIIAS